MFSLTSCLNRVFSSCRRQVTNSQNPKSQGRSRNDVSPVRLSSAPQITQESIGLSEAVNSASVCSSKGSSAHGVTRVSVGSRDYSSSLFLRVLALMCMILPASAHVSRLALVHSDHKKSIFGASDDGLGISTQSTGIDLSVEDQQVLQLSRLVSSFSNNVSVPAIQIGDGVLREEGNDFIYELAGGGYLNISSIPQIQTALENQKKSVSVLQSNVTDISQDLKRVEDTLTISVSTMNDTLTELNNKVASIPTVFSAPGYVHEMRTASVSSGFSKNLISWPSGGSGRGASISIKVVYTYGSSAWGCELIYDFTFTGGTDNSGQLVQRVNQPTTGISCALNWDSGSRTVSFLQTGGSGADIKVLVTGISFHHTWATGVDPSS